jgi:hypothetical protein
MLGFQQKFKKSPVSACTPSPKADNMANKPIYSILIFSTAISPQEMARLKCAGSNISDCTFDHQSSTHVMLIRRCAEHPIGQFQKISSIEGESAPSFDMFEGKPN